MVRTSLCCRFMSTRGDFGLADEGRTLGAACMPGATGAPGLFGRLKPPFGVLCVLGELGVLSALIWPTSLTAPVGLASTCFSSRWLYESLCVSILKRTGGDAMRL
eukprot:6190845-Pleurochrysis_carterae.AAC.1